MDRNIQLFTLADLPRAVCAGLLHAPSSEQDLKCQRERVVNKTYPPENKPLDIITVGSTDLRFPVFTTGNLEHSSRTFELHTFSVTSGEDGCCVNMVNKNNHIPETMQSLVYVSHADISELPTAGMCGPTTQTWLVHRDTV